MHNKWEELIPFYITGTLSEFERMSLEQHLQICDDCNRVLMEWTDIANAVHSIASKQSQRLPPLSETVRLSVMNKWEISSRASQNGDLGQVSSASVIVNPAFRLESQSRKMLKGHWNLPITAVAVSILVLAFIGILIFMVSRRANNPDDNSYLSSNNTLVADAPSQTATLSESGVDDLGILTVSPNEIVQSATYPALQSTPTMPNLSIGVGGGGDDILSIGTGNQDDLCNVISVNGASINVYDLPSPESNVVGSIDAGELWFAVLRSIENWHNVIDQSSSESGWVFVDGTVLSGNCEVLPFATPINSITPISPYEQCLISGNDQQQLLNIYSLPSYDSEVVYTMQAQTTAVAIGHLDNHEWYQIRYIQGIDSWQGWVNNADAVLYFACDDLPEIENITIVPTITPSPELSVIVSSTPLPRIVMFEVSPVEVSPGQIITIEWQTQNVSRIWLEYYDPAHLPTESTSSSYAPIGLYRDLPASGTINVIVPQDYAYDEMYFGLVLESYDRTGRQAGETLTVDIVQDTN